MSTPILQVFSRANAKSGKRITYQINPEFRIQASVSSLTEVFFAQGVARELLLCYGINEILKEGT